MSNRLMYTLGFFTICALLATGFYLQYVEGIIPCPLCLLQRFTFALLGLFFLLGILLHAKRTGCLLINFCASLGSLLGMVLSSRQLWLQYFPSANANGCGLSLQYMLKILPLKDVAQHVFTGSTECSERTWAFLGLDMAGWALLWFTFFLVVTGYMFMKEWRR